MFDVIERLKAEWTDKYVVVDARAPELARFAAATGQVRTVNMNGRCLVEFAQFNNTGWYDIDPSRLKVVPKPVAPPEGEKPQAKASPKAASGDTPKPAAKAAGKPAPAAGKPSTADILAAARAKAPAPAKPAAAKPSTAEILAAARAKGGAGAAPAKTPAGETPPAAAGRPSTAEILARARAGKPAAQEPASQPHADVQESAVPEATAAPQPTPQAAKAPAGGSPLPTTTAEKIAWCRAHDAQG